MVNSAESSERSKLATITGVCGFIGSHLLERLLHEGWTVRGLDDLSTGKLNNLEEVRRSVGEDRWQRFHFIRGDIRVAEDCERAVRGAQILFHLAAVSSVPRSVADPVGTLQTNVVGYAQVLEQARQAGVKRAIYASSAAVYGRASELPCRESAPMTNFLSPYAAHKYENEILGGIFHRLYGLETIGLRFFNIYGPRQDPSGPYATVICKWMTAFLNGRPCVAFGDGTQTRDFCHVNDVIDAILSAARSHERYGIFNVGSGEASDLKSLHTALGVAYSLAFPESTNRSSLVFDSPREGDILHSQADITQARNLLGFRPHVKLEDGLKETLLWFRKEHAD